MKPPSPATPLSAVAPAHLAANGRTDTPRQLRSATHRGAARTVFVISLRFDLNGQECFSRNHTAG